MLDPSRQPCVVGTIEFRPGGLIAGPALLYKQPFGVNVHAILLSANEGLGARRRAERRYNDAYPGRRGLAIRRGQLQCLETKTGRLAGRESLASALRRNDDWSANSRAGYPTR